MALVPVQQRLGLAGDGGVARRQHKRSGAHVLELALAQCGFGFARQIDREQGLRAVQPQEYAGRAVPFVAPGQEPRALVLA